MSINLSDYRQVFLGKCMGIGLKERGLDKHVCIDILVEDDGSWHLEDDGGISSHWLPELLLRVIDAQNWITDNCDHDISKEDNRVYGWKFKD